MKPFIMQLEYIDAETGAMMTETILIDDFEVQPADPFQPEPDYGDDCPW